MAAPSFCAHLPEKGAVVSAAPPEMVAARPRADRSLICPPGFTLDPAARIPVCTRPGRGSVEGDPRAACRASLPLGPITPLPAQWRPTRSCPGGDLKAIIRLEGTNLGLAEVEASASPGVTLETLTDDAAGKGALKPADRPSAQGCFAHQCRLLRITIAADAPDEVELRLAIKDGASTITRVPLISHCPDPLAKR